MSKEIDIGKECCDIWNKLKDKTKMIDYLIESKKQVADLEAKLAELNKEPLNCSQLEKGMSLCIIQKSEIAKLKQQLAEKDKAIENWQTMYQSVMRSSYNGIEEDKRLREQLAECERDSNATLSEYRAIKYENKQLNKALELACEQIWAMSIWENTKEEIIQDNIKFFKNKAKEMKDE